MKKQGCNPKSPMVGIVTRDGYVESYNYSKGKKFDFHHNFIMSQKAITTMEDIDDNNALRFIHYNKCTQHDKNTYTLEGEPALDPFNKGAKQIKKFVEHVLENGADPTMEVEVLNHHLGSIWEGKTLGTLSELRTRLKK